MDALRRSVGQDAEEDRPDSELLGLVSAQAPRLVYLVTLTSRLMDIDHDPQVEAEAAMKQAVRTDGPERQRWIELALAWFGIARMRPDKVGTGLR